MSVWFTVRGRVKSKIPVCRFTLRLSRNINVWMLRTPKIYLSLAPETRPIHVVSCGNYAEFFNVTKKVANRKHYSIQIIKVGVVFGKEN